MAPGSLFLLFSLLGCTTVLLQGCGSGAGSGSGTTGTTGGSSHSRSSSTDCYKLQKDKCVADKACEWLWTGNSVSNCLKKDWTCTGLRNEQCKATWAKKKGCEWKWSGDWKTSCTTSKTTTRTTTKPKPRPPTTTTTTTTTKKFSQPTSVCNGLKSDACGKGATSGKCEWFFTGNWQTSCMPTGCDKLSHDQCDVKQAKKSCDWLWTGAWNTSCVKSGWVCQGLKGEQCKAAGAKKRGCAWKWTGEWRTSCVNSTGASLVEEEAAGGSLAAGLRGQALRLRRQSRQ